MLFMSEMHDVHFDESAMRVLLVETNRTCSVKLIAYILFYDNSHGFKFMCSEVLNLDARIKTNTGFSNQTSRDCGKVNMCTFCIHWKCKRKDEIIKLRSDFHEGCTSNFWSIDSRKADCM